MHMPVAAQEGMEVASIHAMALSGRQRAVQRAGGEMGRRYREFDWSGTSIGPPEGWSLTWRNAAHLIFNSSYPLALGLGKDLVYLYNDAFIPLGGPARHPSALGQPVRTVWKEIWPGILLPRFTHTLETSEPTGEEDLLLPLFRSGYLEETYISFSFAALPDDTGRPSGIFCTATENTGRVIARRQIDCLQRLAAHSASADSPENACRTAAATLDEQERDVPCGLIYLFDSKSARATVTGSFGLRALPATIPGSVDLGTGQDPFSLAAIASGHKSLLIEGVEDLFRPVLSREDWVPRQALALPVASPASQAVAGMLVAGLNPMRPVEESREFLVLVAGQLETAISNARARQEAEERARQLIEIDRAKTVFFSNISHELRTPLTLVLGPVGEVLGGTAISARERDLLETACRAGNRLLKLIKSLLEVARLEAGRVEASYSPVDLAALTVDLASEFRSAFEQAGLALRVECPPLAENVYVDPEMWEKIVLNLLSNAFKFTRRGAVTVRLRQHDESAVLEVIDTGCGISEEDVPHLFERFYRGRAEETRSVEGTGIGLSLVRELVRLHAGTVKATSKIGRGTTMTVSIPLGTEHLPRDRIGAARKLPSLRTGPQPFIDEALGWISTTGAVPLPADFRRAADPADSSAARRKPQERVLIADDNSDMRNYLCRLLEDRYRIDAAEDGQVALAKMRAQQYDLAIVDVMMPSVTGLELLQAVRADPAIAHTPVILVSARAGEKASVEGLQAGADDYLVKPFSGPELLARVENQLTHARLHAAERLARQRAEAALRAHDDLYSVLAHDLRSPLHTAYMCLTLLQQQGMDAAQRKSLDGLERSIDSLHQQLEAVLEQIKAISGDEPARNDARGLGRRLHRHARGDRKLQ